MKKINDVDIDRERMTEWEHDGHKISIARDENGMHATIDNRYDGIMGTDAQGVIEWVFNQLGIRYAQDGG